MTYIFHDIKILMKSCFRGEIYFYTSFLTKICLIVFNVENF